MAKAGNGGIGQRVADAVSPVTELQKSLSAAIGDIGRIADGMQYLPELLEVLADIDKRVSAIQDEMSRMRSGVEELQGMRGAIDELHRPLAELSSSLHPLQRLGDRLRPGRRGDVEGVVEGDDLAEGGAPAEGGESAESELPRGPTPGL